MPVFLCRHSESHTRLYHYFCVGYNGCCGLNLCEQYCDAQYSHSADLDQSRWLLFWLMALKAKVWNSYEYFTQRAIQSLTGFIRVYIDDLPKNKRDVSENEEHDFKCSEAMCYFQMTYIASNIAIFFSNKVFEVPWIDNSMHYIHVHDCIYSVSVRQPISQYA